MKNTNDPQPTDNLFDLIRQMEGVENNAFTIRLLGKIFQAISTDHVEAEHQMFLMLSVLEEVHADAWERLTEMRELPEEEHHYLINGEISAQEEFVKIIASAFAPDNGLTDATRLAFVMDAVEAHAQDAESSVAEPLAMFRAIAEEAIAAEEAKGAPVNVTIH